MLNGLFISPHQGFIAEMEQSLPCIPDTKWTFRASFINDWALFDEMQSAVLNIVGHDELIKSRSGDYLDSKLYCHDPAYLSEMYDKVIPFWREKSEAYFPHYKELLRDIDQYNIVILGLSPFIHHFIRRLNKNVPVIFYPRMLVESAATIPILHEADFVYVTHDEHLHSHKLFGESVHQKLIMSSLNPAFYGPWSGDINAVMTMFNFLYRVGQTDTGSNEQESNGVIYLSMPALYERMTNGFPHILFGDNHTNQHFAMNVDGHLIPDVMRRFRCSISFSRSFSAITTAQLLASGIPSIFWVNAQNEIYDIIEPGVSGFITTDIDTVRSIVSDLLKDSDYAQQIGSAGRDAYYKHNKWDEHIRQWTELIHQCAR